MKKKVLFALIITACVSLLNAQTTSTYMKIVLDTKQLSPDYGLLLQNANKVYAHLGLCTCSMDGTGISATRNCSDTAENRQYCYSQITPYRSNVWQHVVGNWGALPQDDGVGQMTAMGNGVYYIEFWIEQYFTDQNLVSTESAGDSVVPSQPWKPWQGGAPYTIGMVFRNEDGTISGRDDGGNDLFIINIQSTSPQVIQSSYPEIPFTAVTFEKQLVVEEVSAMVKRFSVVPNPFGENTFINYSLKDPAKDLSIEIYNLLGQKVTTLFSGMRSAGKHQVEWTGTSDSGNFVKSGLYILKIKSGNEVIYTERIVKK